MIVSLIILNCLLLIGFIPSLISSQIIQHKNGGTSSVRVQIYQTGSKSVRHGKQALVDFNFDVRHPKKGFFNIENTEAGSVSYSPSKTLPQYPDMNFGSMERNTFENNNPDNYGNDYHQIRGIPSTSAEFYQMRPNKNRKRSRPRRLYPSSYSNNYNMNNLNNKKNKKQQISDMLIYRSINYGYADPNESLDTIYTQLNQQNEFNDYSNSQQHHQQQQQQLIDMFLPRPSQGTHRPYHEPMDIIPPNQNYNSRRRQRQHEYEQSQQNSNQAATFVHSNSLEDQEDGDSYDDGEVEYETRFQIGPPPPGDYSHLHYDTDNELNDDDRGNQNFDKNTQNSMKSPDNISMMKNLKNFPLTATDTTLINQNQNLELQTQMDQNLQSQKNQDLNQNMMDYQNTNAPTSSMIHENMHSTTTNTMMHKNNHGESNGNNRDFSQNQNTISQNMMTQYTPTNVQNAMIDSDYQNMHTSKIDTFSQNNQENQNVMSHSTADNRISMINQGNMNINNQQPVINNENSIIPQAQQVQNQIFKEPSPQIIQKFQNLRPQLQQFPVTNPTVQHYTQDTTTIEPFYTQQQEQRHRIEDEIEEEIMKVNSKYTNIGFGLKSDTNEGFGSNLNINQFQSLYSANNNAQQLPISSTPSAKQPRPQSNPISFKTAIVQDFKDNLDDQDSNPTPTFLPQQQKTSASTEISTFASGVSSKIFVTPQPQQQKQQDHLLQQGQAFQESFVYGPPKNSEYQQYGLPLGDKPSDSIQKSNYSPPMSNGNMATVHQQQQQQTMNYSPPLQQQQQQQKMTFSQPLSQQQAINFAPPLQQMNFAQPSVAQASSNTHQQMGYPAEFRAPSNQQQSGGYPTAAVLQPQMVYGAPSLGYPEFRQPTGTTTNNAGYQKAPQNQIQSQYGPPNSGDFSQNRPQHVQYAPPVISAQSQSVFGPPILSVPQTQTMYGPPHQVSAQNNQVQYASPPLGGSSTNSQLNGYTLPRPQFGAPLNVQGGFPSASNSNAQTPQYTAPDFKFQAAQSIQPHYMDPGKNFAATEIRPETSSIVFKPEGQTVVVEAITHKPVLEKGSAQTFIDNFELPSGTKSKSGSSKFQFHIVPRIHVYTNHVTEDGEATNLKPAAVYGVPKESRPAPVYGLPNESESESKTPYVAYGVPKDGKESKASPVYRLPEEESKQPEVTYGLPKEGKESKPSPVYGLPQEETRSPSITYGLPRDGKESKKRPVYGLPNEDGRESIKIEYGPPKHQASVMIEYGPPKHDAKESVTVEYGPPKQSEESIEIVQEKETINVEYGPVAVATTKGTPSEIRRIVTGEIPGKKGYDYTPAQARKKEVKGGYQSAQTKVEVKGGYPAAQTKIEVKGGYPAAQTKIEVKGGYASAQTKKEVEVKGGYAAAQTKKQVVEVRANNLIPRISSEGFNPKLGSASEQKVLVKSADNSSSDVKALGSYVLDSYEVTDVADGKFSFTGKRTDGKSSSNVVHTMNSEKGANGGQTVYLISRLLIVGKNTTTTASKDKDNSNVLEVREGGATTVFKKFQNTNTNSNIKNMNINMNMNNNQNQMKRNKMIMMNNVVNANGNMGGENRIFYQQNRPNKNMNMNMMNKNQQRRMDNSNIQKNNQNRRSMPANLSLQQILRQNQQQQQQQQNRAIMMNGNENFRNNNMMMLNNNGGNGNANGQFIRGGARFPSGQPKIQQIQMASRPNNIINKQIIKQLEIINHKIEKIEEQISTKQQSKRQIGESNSSDSSSSKSEESKSENSQTNESFISNENGNSNMDLNLNVQEHVNNNKNA